MIYLQVLPKQVTLRLVFAYLSSKNPPLFLGPCYDSITAYVFTDNYFLFTSMLMDALRSMDVSRYPDSLTSYPCFPYHVPLARVLVCSRSRLMCFLLYQYGLSTRLWSLACFPFLLLCCRLVHLHFSFMSLRLSHRLVCSDSYHLCLSFCSLSTCLPPRYFWTLTRY